MQGTNNCILGKTSFWPALACSYNAVVKTKLLILMELNTWMLTGQVFIF